MLLRLRPSGVSLCSFPPFLLPIYTYTTHIPFHPHLNKPTSHRHRGNSILSVTFATTQERRIPFGHSFNHCLAALLLWPISGVFASTLKQPAFPAKIAQVNSSNSSSNHLFLSRSCSLCTFSLLHRSDNNKRRQRSSAGRCLEPNKEQTIYPFDLSSVITAVHLPPQAAPIASSSFFYCDSRLESCGCGPHFNQRLITSRYRVLDLDLNLPTHPHIHNGDLSTTSYCFGNNTRTHRYSSYGTISNHRPWCDPNTGLLLRSGPWAEGIWRCHWSIIRLLSR